MIRAHYQIDPNELTDEQWAQKFGDYLLYKKMDQHFLEEAIATVVSKIIPQDVK